MPSRAVAALLILSLAGPGAVLAKSPTGGSPAGLPALAYPERVPSELKTPAAKAARPEKPGPELICDLIDMNARATGMPPSFFARLIWKESRFDIGAISPVGAQGIAQFMPYTAAERGLDDPFNLNQAIRHSALYLKDLKDDLGNWGLAAAAYNGGVNRVRSWLAEGGSLPLETEDYVNAITFRPADWFREPGREIEEKPLSANKSFAEACQDLPIMKTRAIFASTSGPESAPMRPWGVQIAGHFNRSVALRMFRNVQKSYASILGGRDPIVLREGIRRGLRPIYAVRIGADSRSEADALCDRLQQAGGSCAVFKN